MRGRCEDLRVDDAGFRIDGDAADIGGSRRVGELGQVDRRRVQPVLADHAPRAVGRDADARQRRGRGHNAYGIQLMSIGGVPVKGLCRAAAGDAVDSRAVGGGGQRGRDHLRGKGGQGGGERLGPGWRKWPIPAWRPRWDRSTTKLVVVTISASPSAVKATPSGGSPVANVWRVLLFRLMSVTSVLAGIRRSEIAVVGNQEELRIEGESQRARLGRHVHGAANRVIRGGHDFDAVGREVGDIEQAARLIEGNIGSGASDRNNRPEGGRPRGHGSARESRRKRNRD